MDATAAAPSAARNVKNIGNPLPDRKLNRPDGLQGRTAAMSSLRRGIEGVCADLAGPLRERKPGVQNRCEAGTPWEEGSATRLPARLRSNRYIRSSPSRRRRSRRAMGPGCSGPRPRPGRQVPSARRDPRPGRAPKQSHGRWRPRCHGREHGVLEAGVRQARGRARHGPWLRLARIEWRSARPPFQRSATMCRSKSCAITTIRSEPGKQRLQMR